MLLQRIGFLFLITLGFAPLALLANSGTQEEAARPPIKMVLVGDSTVTDNAGWGLGFQQFLADQVQLFNTSRGGRSSRTFREEGRWDDALALQADYYLIQFGHNDQPGKPERSTTHQQYRENLLRYVQEAKTAGATAVLITPLVRREFRDPEHPNRIVSSLEPWAKIVRDVAQQTQTPYVELHDLSKQWCEQMGRQGVSRISPIKPNGRYDGTHLNSAGYLPVGQMVAQQLKQQVPDLARYLLDAPRTSQLASGAVDFDAVVQPDGHGTHRTLQAAIDAAPQDATADHQYRILVRPGVYQEHLVVARDKAYIQVLGEPGQESTTILSQDTHVKTPDPARPGEKLSTQDSSTALIQANNLTFRNLTFRNTTTREDRVQALACYVTGDRVAFYNCRFLGWQDTLRVESARSAISRQYFRQCYIEGHVDYIYGSGTAVFDACHLHTKADGYITAASTPESSPYGYLFTHCKLTTGTDVKRGVYLGRPWRPHAAVTWIQCTMDQGIRSEGWHNWGNPDNEATARYAEYQCKGPGADTAGRVTWSHQLTPSQASEISVQAVLSGTDNWRPVR